jgi:hypothetical protein
MNSPIDGCVACWCAELACASDSDCPSPPGDATAACDEGVCVQRCEDELDCPTGMNCALATSDYPDGILAPEADGLRRCVWPIDDAFVCDGVSESDGDDFRDPCAEIGDPEACGAMTSTELSQRCAWLEFSALAPDGCESLASVGQCVHIVDGVCDPGNRCDDSEAHVYTRRDGERTLVAALPGCATVVAGPSGEIRPCNLDAPWTDESCGCAC